MKKRTTTDTNWLDGKIFKQIIQYFDTKTWLDRKSSDLTFAWFVSCYPGLLQRNGHPWKVWKVQEVESFVLEASRISWAGPALNGNDKSLILKPWHRGRRSRTRPDNSTSHCQIEEGEKNHLDNNNIDTFDLVEKISSDEQLIWIDFWRWGKMFGQLAKKEIHHRKEEEEKKWELMNRIALERERGWLIRNLWSRTFFLLPIKKVQREKTCFNFIDQLVFVLDHIYWVRRQKEKQEM